MGAENPLLAEEYQVLGQNDIDDGQWGQSKTFVELRMQATTWALLVASLVNVEMIVHVHMDKYLAHHGSEDAFCFWEVVCKMNLFLYIEEILLAVVSRCLTPSCVHAQMIMWPIQNIFAKL